VVGSVVPQVEDSEMPSPKSPSVDPPDGVLVVSTVVDAPPARVFDAWTRGEELARWFYPRGLPLVAHTFDVRPGGAYRVCMRGIDGTDYWVHGVYREIVAPRRLVFTHVWESGPSSDTVVTVTFADRGGLTEITVHQAVFDSCPVLDGHRLGWTSCFEQLAATLAAAPT
jgi:uncharacterized protein YndB with AHSA1/START domain